MRRKRLHLSVTLAVLGLGMALVWAFGAPGSQPPGHDAVVSHVLEAADTQPLVEHEGRQDHAFRMPYFSFKALARPVPAPTGIRAWP